MTLNSEYFPPISLSSSIPIGQFAGKLGAAIGQTEVYPQQLTLQPPVCFFDLMAQTSELAFERETGVCLPSSKFLIDQQFEFLLSPRSIYLDATKVYRRAQLRV